MARSVMIKSALVRARTTLFGRGTMKKCGQIGVLQGNWNLCHLGPPCVTGRPCTGSTLQCSLVRSVPPWSVIRGWLVYFITSTLRFVCVFCLCSSLPLWVCSFMRVCCCSTSFWNNFDQLSMPQSLVLCRLHIKMPTKARFPLPELTARINGPSWRVTGFHYPLTRAVFTPLMGPRFH